ncbi:MAG: hypothetical protein KBC26_00630 [Candidatus Pacebacteria bacterium]|nr:hypothetical protein [Candidatus Paceibacterota bacterium]
MKKFLWGGVILIGLLVVGLHAHAQEIMVPVVPQQIGNTLTHEEARALQRGLYALEGIVLQLQYRVAHNTIPLEAKPILAAHMGKIQVSLALVTTQMTVLAADTTATPNQEVAAQAPLDEEGGEPSQENVEAFSPVKDETSQEASVQASVNPRDFTWPIVIIAALMCIAIASMIIKNKLAERSSGQKIEVKQQASISQSQPTQPIQQPPQSNNIQQ